MRPLEKEPILVKSMAFYHLVTRLVLNRNLTDEDVGMAERKIKYVLDELRDERD